MTYDDICDHIVAARFKGSQLPQVRRWVQYRYSKLWSHADWPWKLVSSAALPVVAGNARPVITSLGIARPRSVYNADGGSLEQMTSEVFDACFRAAGSAGSPSAWKWENGVLTLGPTPQASAAFAISYDRRIAHRDSTGATIVDGSMSADADLPVWDNREFDYILVPGAIATGLKEENDPTWKDLEEEFQFGNTDMVEYYLPTVVTHGNLSYGADTL